MAAITILPTPVGIDVVCHDVRVRIDASAQTWRLDDGRTTAEFGAVSAGCLDVIGAVADALGRPATDDGLVPLWESLRRALAWQADLKGLRDPVLEGQIAAIHPTPLLYSAPFLAARFLRDDARRFHACRVAIAHGEDDHVDASDPEIAAVIVERLTRWRDLFAKDGKAKRGPQRRVDRLRRRPPRRGLVGAAAGGAGAAAAATRRPRDPRLARCPGPRRWR